MIYLRALTGRTYTLEVEPSDTIGTLKMKFEDKTGIPVAVQRHIYSGRFLEDDRRTLADFNISRDTTLHVVLRLRVPGPPAPTPLDLTAPFPQISLHHQG